MYWHTSQTSCPPVLNTVLRHGRHGPQLSSSNKRITDAPLTYLINGDERQ